MTLTNSISFAPELPFKVSHDAQYPTIRGRRASTFGKNVGLPFLPNSGFVPSMNYSDHGGSLSEDIWVRGSSSTINQNFHAFSSSHSRTKVNTNCQNFGPNLFTPTYYSNFFDEPNISSNPFHNSKSRLNPNAKEFNSRNRAANIPHDSWTSRSIELPRRSSNESFLLDANEPIISSTPIKRNLSKLEETLEIVSSNNFLMDSSSSSSASLGTASHPQENHLAKPFQMLEFEDFKPENDSNLRKFKKCNNGLTSAKSQHKENDGDIEMNQTDFYGNYDVNSLVCSPFSEENAHISSEKSIIRSVCLPSENRVSPHLLDSFFAPESAQLLERITLDFLNFLGKLSLPQRMAISCSEWL